MMMVTEREIREYKKRRAARIMERVARFDAAQRLAYGLAKGLGIDTKGMSPGEVWAKIREKTGKEARDFYSASGSTGAEKIRFGTASKKAFAKALSVAKGAVDKAKQWRVTGMNLGQLRKWHPNAKLHVTDAGSTVAVDHNGDIVAVCGNPNDNVKGQDLIAFAVKNGGTKLDSYDGNHGFYLRCGFEPVSWCKWDPKFKPPGWDESGAMPEDVIFYKYTGNKQKLTPAQAAEHLNKFKKKVVPADDYDSAYDQRDKEIK